MIAVLLTIALGSPAVIGGAHDEIPAFARKYGVSCNLCHDPFPTLTAFGEQFAANGFRLAPDELPRDTIDTGDDLLQLARVVPLAFRLDAYAQTYANGSAASDFQTPWNLKILSGGTISSGLSYYLYFFLYERGEVGGIEDAFIYANDILGAPVDAAIGQFQVSDPMFKRELRLEFEDYAIYRARIGAQPADLTYDRGVMGIAEAGGFTFTATAVNGNGRGEAEPDRRLDDNAFKNLFGHLTRDFGPVRLGAMGYWGRQSGSIGDGPEVVNTVWMAGGDATVTARPFELNVQYIHREDDAPMFSPGEATAQTDGGFAELIYRPSDSRWYAVGLYNYIETDRPLLDVRLETPAALDRYQTVAGGLGYLLRRNFRLHGEVLYDVEQERTRFTLGLTTAF